MNGGRVSITSRNKETGFYADPQSTPHVLPFLIEEENWELLIKKIFGSTNAVCPRELDEMRENCSKLWGFSPCNCRLRRPSIKKRKEKTPLSWQKILDSLTWHLNQGPDSCLGVVALSYDGMPYYLKSSFLYCGLS